MRVAIYRHVGAKRYASSEFYRKVVYVRIDLVYYEAGFLGVKAICKIFPGKPKAVPYAFFLAFYFVGNIAFIIRDWRIYIDAVFLLEEQVCVKYADMANVEKAAWFSPETIALFCPSRSLE
ncbi:MAG: hypothetical protein ACP5UH_03240 [Candidatus Micrarchaeia archaeon]